MEVRLNLPRDRSSVRVFDVEHRAVHGARVGVLDHAVATAQTERDVRFQIDLPAPSRKKVTVHVESPKDSAQDALCYLGVNCPVYLED